MSIDGLMQSILTGTWAARLRDDIEALIAETVAPLNARIASLLEAVKKTAAECEASDKKAAELSEETKALRSKLNKVIVANSLAVAPLHARIAELETYIRILEGQSLEKSQIILKAKAALAAQGAEPKYLVVTGDVVGGEETYTVHDKPVPMADNWTLYTRPPAAEQTSNDDLGTPAGIRRMEEEQAEALKDADLLEAAKQALSALETYAQTYNDYWESGMDILEPIADAAIPRLRAAIASAEGAKQ